MASMNIAVVHGFEFAKFAMKLPEATSGLSTKTRRVLHPVDPRTFLIYNIMYIYMYMYYILYHMLYNIIILYHIIL
jgi:hypothetical protein